MSAPHAFALGFDNAYRGDLHAWQEALRAKLMEAVGLDRAPCGGFTIADTSTGSTDGLRQNRYMVRPEPWGPQPIYEIEPAGRSNGITLLAFHGHGSPDHFSPGGMYHYIWDLARSGYRVIVPILYGKLERETRHLPYTDARDAMAVCDAWSVDADALGLSLLGVRLFDAMLAYRFAICLPSVDPARVGSVGLSMGGELAIYLPALVPDIRCTVSAGFLCSYAKGLLELRTFCPCYSIRGWPQMFDMPDIAGCVAPRPMLIQKGAEDGCIDPQDAEDAFANLQRIYAASGHPQNVEYVTYPGGHRLNVQKAEEWFRAHMDHDV